MSGKAIKASTVQPRTIEKAGRPTAWAIARPCLSEPCRFVAAGALGSSVLGALTLQLDIVLDAHHFDLLELGLEEVDVLLLGLEDSIEEGS